MSIQFLPENSIKFHGSKPWNMLPVALGNSPLRASWKKISSKVRDGFFQDGSDSTGGEFPPVNSGKFFCQKFDEKYIKIHHVYYRSICFITLDIHFVENLQKFQRRVVRWSKNWRTWIDHVKVFVWNGKLEADDTEEEETLGLKMDS